MKNRIIQLLGGVPRSKYAEVQDAHSQSISDAVRSRGDAVMQLTQLRRDLTLAQETIRTREAQLDQAAATLQQIAECGANSSNGTARKMARLAREALS